MWGCCWWPGCGKVMPGQASSLCSLVGCMCGCICTAGPSTQQRWRQVVDTVMAHWDQECHHLPTASLGSSKDIAASQGVGQGSPLNVAQLVPLTGA